MNNYDVLKSLLQPRNDNDSKMWNIFLEFTRYSKSIWYPSSGHSFSDLMHKLKAKSVDSKNSIVHIHTDYFPDKEMYEFLYNGRLVTIDEKDIAFELNGLVELKLKQPLPEVDYLRLPRHVAIILAKINNNTEALKNLNTNNEGNDEENRMLSILRPKSFDEIVALADNENFQLANRIFLLDVKVSGTIDINKRYVLYFFYENRLFFENVILKSGLKITYLWNKIFKTCNEFKTDLDYLKSYIN